MRKKIRMGRYYYWCGKKLGLWQVDGYWHIVFRTNSNRFGYNELGGITERRWLP